MQGDLATNAPGARAAQAEQAARRSSPVRFRLARLFGAHTEERAWRLGRKGEVAVGARLARLPPEWRILHAIPVGSKGSDIAILRLARAACSRSTPNITQTPVSGWAPDCFMVNGHRQPYVRNGRHEAARASRILSQQVGFPVPVVGLIAVMGAQKGFVVKSQPEDGNVQVVARKQVHTWLQRRRPILNSSEIATVFDVARRPQTWTG